MPVTKKTQEQLISLENHGKSQELEAPATSESGGTGGTENCKWAKYKKHFATHIPTSTVAET